MRPLLAMLVTLLVTAACAPSLHIHTPDPAAHRHTLRDAGRMMGLRVKTVDQGGSGVIELEFKPNDEGICGVALEKIVGYPEHPRETAELLIEAAKNKDAIAAARAVVNCTPRAWSCDRPDFVSHELGHILGLTHKEGTTMAPAPTPDLEFTDTQMGQMALVAVGFALVCGDPEGNISDPLEPEEASR